MANSAEQEIAAFSGDTSARDWLINKGMLDDSSDEYSVEVVSEWYRAGAESYILDFLVNQSRDNTDTTRRYIAKACIKVPCSDNMNDWVSRRKTLEAAGVNTPRLYAVKKAVLIEDHVPHDLKTAFDAAGEDGQRRIVANLFDMYDRIQTAGFQPRPFHDLRSHGDDVVAVDFGEDLGAQAESAALDYDRKAILRVALGKSASIGFNYAN